MVASEKMQKHLVGQLCLSRYCSIVYGTSRAQLSLLAIRLSRSLHHSIILPPSTLIPPTQWRRLAHIKPSEDEDDSDFMDDMDDSPPLERADADDGWSLPTIRSPKVDTNGKGRNSAR